jgi:predicted phage terminase large subunit-like protein
MSWIPATIKGYAAPRHLAPLVELLERAQREPVLAVVHAPPRHAKTETIISSLAWGLRKDPAKTHAYATYGAELSRSKSRKVRDYARRAGVQLREDAAALAEWLTTDGGGLLATSVMGPFTGKGVTGVLVVDDPVKNRVDAESPLIRDRTWEWFNEVAFTRREPGSSVIVVMTRWHEDDLAGRLLKQKDVRWESISLKAISEDGHALWPERYDERALDLIHRQIGEYSWASLYQGMPRPRAGRLFQDCQTYLELPTEHDIKRSIGVDLAYTAKTQADYSVAMPWLRHGSKFYITGCVREQEQAPEFCERMKKLRKTHPGAKFRWYASGTEKGVGDFIKKAGVPIEVVVVTTDKFQRAQPVAAAWNRGDVLVPASDSPHYGPWVDTLLDEFAMFTGVGDVNDDQVDAGAAGYDLIAPGYAADRFRMLAKLR